MLTSITIPKGVTKIGDKAFNMCDILKRLVVPWDFYLPSSSFNSPKHGDRIGMAPVVIVQGVEGSVKTIEVADGPEGAWRFWMGVTATESGVAVTDLDEMAFSRFYRVKD